MGSKVAPNAKMSGIARQSKVTKGAISNPNHAKALTGVSIDCGLGGETNTGFGAGISTRGMKEAMNPKGPGGK